MSFISPASPQEHFHTHRHFSSCTIRSMFLIFMTKYLHNYMTSPVDSAGFGVQRLLANGGMLRHQTKMVNPVTVLLNINMSSLSLSFVMLAAYVHTYIFSVSKCGNICNSHNPSEIHCVLLYIIMD